MTTETTQERIEIPIIVEKGVTLPHYASTGASGADVTACITEPVEIQPGQTRLVSTGLKVAIPEGYEIQVRPRSGLAFKHSITVLNTPGTIDADYRGDIGVILINHGSEPFTVTPGMRIAQIVVTPIILAKFTSTDSLGDTLRGGGGFGHTGTH